MDEHGYVMVRGRRRARSSAQTLQAWEQSTRSKWRALLACIKAKLISAESGIETLEEAFLANVVTSEGTTVWQDVVRRSADGYLQAPSGTGLMLPAGDAP
jgi:predicted secreted protein